MILPANTSPDSSPEITGYAIIEQLYLGARTAVYRAVQTTTQRPVVIKVLRRDYPSFGELVQFRNQYTIAKNLPIPGIVQPLSLEPIGNSYALVMEDYGGVSLGKYVQQQSLELTEVLAIALQISDILHDLCQHWVVHKDIKPGNILIHPESKQVKLIDFSIASLLPKETQEIQSPNILEGTLAYLAPEQTGRMNRGIDYRADFYTLGVTLYQLLTETLPFASDDLLELVHCHIAKIPVSVNQVNPGVPAMVAAIVAKLMAKNAEDRYQSAIGLKHDLERCLTQWKATGAIAEFELGQRDLSDRFLIPEKLYGRETEIAELLLAFERVASGSSELMLVAGFSGIGKTAVVNEVHKPIVRQRGYFIKGKFDQFNRNIPLSAFVQALRDLIGQLLCESDEQLAQWRTQILAALGENGQVMIEVIPELEQMIGAQPSVVELSGSAAQNRFNLLFQKFIAVLTTAEHPLVIFLDDLQWADLASLQLIKLLMNDNSYLLMLGAYRDNEVSPTHPFILTVAELKKTQAIVNTIILTPLAFDHTNHLVADTLSCSRELAQPLSELIDRKTQGNPFFTTQFLKALHEDGYISFNCDRRYWECDIVQVNTLTLTSDVVEFMALQLQKLPAATQQVLKLAACVGNQFDLATLAIVSEQSSTDAATALWKALQEGLILPTSQVYKFFQGAEQSQAEDSVNSTYRFLHDRVQQAAYSLIPDRQKQATHLLIARLLRQNTSDAELEAKVFEIVNHWNSAIALVIDPFEKDNLVQLNLIAGRKAKASTAYEPALQYFQTGLSLLSDSWQRQPLLMLALQEEAAEAAYLCGNFAQMEQWVSEILAQNLNPLDCVKAYIIQIQAYTSQSRYHQALAIARTALKPFNIHLPEQPMPADIAPARQEVAELLNGRTAAELLDLPVMTAAEPLAVMQLLSSITVTAYISAPLLYPFVVLSQVKLSIQHGNSTLSAFGYSHYATLSSILEYLDVAYEFGQLGLQLVAKFNARTIQAKVNFIVGVGIIHCKSHFRGSLPLFMEAFQVGLEVGDLEFAGYSLQNLCQCAYWIGKNLTTLVAETETYVATLLKLNRTTSSNYTHLVLDSIQRLQGNQSQLASSASSQQLHTALITAKDLLGLHYYWIYQLTTSYLLNEITQAMQAAAQARQTLAAGGYLITVRFFYFYDSLTALATNAEAVGKNLLLERVAANQAKLQHRAYHAPMNFQHKYDLVEAERHRVLGNKASAIEFYDLAISRAKANGYIQEEALANELAAKFYLDWGKEKIAQDYLIHAYYGYAHWGAKAKVQDLEHRYPKLLAPILQQQRTSLSATETLSASVYLTSATQSSTSSSTSISATLDLATVLKASQTLSSEIQLDKLLATLLHTVLENAGADKGALLMPRQQQWFVEAVATLDQPARIQSIAMSSSSEIPHTLINAVKHSLQPVVIVDTAAHPTLATDAYVVEQQPKSILCTPILQQGKLVAILYLENHVIAGAFTSDRVELLNFLCTQAAISLENARLYQQSQQAEATLQEREQFLSSIYDGAEMCIFVIDVSSDGNFRYAGWNTLAQRVFGIRNADIVGKTSIEVFGVDQGESMNQWLAGSVKAGTFIYAEQYIPIEGQDSWWFATLNPLKNEQGQVYRIIGTAFDVSDRKRAEAATTQKSQELEQALQDLQNTQLQMVQSEKMASLGNLVAGVAHEINNPIGFLNGSINNAKDYVQDILGHLTLYQQHHPDAAAPVQENAQNIDLEFLSEDLPKLLDSMQGATDRIKSISTSLRTFSRTDTEHKVSANLHEGIDSTLLILKYRLKANEYRPAIQVVQDYGDLLPVKCFPGQLNQVFMNILANAIDVFDEAAQQSSFADLQANPQKITIQTALTPQNAVEIRIGDNGKGMSSEVKARIFDHLFTTKAVGKGTGLGLAIARQIVIKKHGGSLEVQSELGQGTEFCIRLPIRVE